VISLLYARRKGDAVKLRRIEDGRPPDKASAPGKKASPAAAGSESANGRADGVLVSRGDFDFQVLDLPAVPDKEIEGLIRYRLRSLYPGSPGETTSAAKRSWRCTGTRPGAPPFCFPIA
jgi:hypothetical protein